MLTMESKGTSNTGSSTGNNGGGFGKGMLALAMIAVIVFGIFGVVSNLGDSKKQDSDNGSTTIIYRDYEVDKDEDEEEVVSDPIKDKYSCQGNYYSIFTNRPNVRDNFGTTYESANMAYVSINSGAKKLTYALDGTYKYLRGTIYLSEKNKDDINYFRVCVYNENGDCIYQSEDISSRNLGPIQVNCNISGMTRVTIELEGCTKTCGGIYIIMPDDGFVFTK